jgi:anti-sigma regulatory factor (Ser/Thr protein kinase)
MLLIKKNQCARRHEMDIEMALREALANAAVHGNHEDRRKHVHVRCRCKADGDVSIVVQDGGQGFDPNAIPDLTSPQAIESSHGRGIYLMRSLMDEVHFDRGGAVVHMRKKSGSTGSNRPKRVVTTKRLAGLVISIGLLAKQNANGMLLGIDDQQSNDLPTVGRVIWPR